MEFTLHKQLKELYCGDIGEVEVRLGSYRIDAVVADTLFEIQAGSPCSDTRQNSKLDTRSLGRCRQAVGDSKAAGEAQSQTRKNR